MELFEFKFGGETHRIKLFPGSSVMIERVKEGTVVDVKLFAMDSLAAFDHTNLIGYGSIVSIGKKTITVRERGGAFGKNHRLKPQFFAILNYDFDAEEAADYNREMSCYI